MTNDLTALVEFFERERGLPREKVMEALESAFITAFRKMGPGRDKIETVNADIDLKVGTVKIFTRLNVVADEDLRDQFNEIPLSLAAKVKPGSDVGDEVDVNVTPKDFGRIAVQSAKQTMLQRIRIAEKEEVYEIYRDRVGEIESGTVRRFERGDVWVDLGKAEGLMPSRERVSTEEYNIGDRIRVYLVEVKNTSRGPEIILSRSHPNLVRRLFESEVTEIADRTVELRGIAREAGFRTKIAVSSVDPKVDPVGACVGMRGARVKNIVRELNNEKVDIIEWSDDPREMVTQALKPADLRSINVDEATRTIHVTVDEEQLAKAIGRKGQNARLSSRLLGWDVQVSQDRSEEERFEGKVNEAAQTLSEQLGVDLEKADAIFRVGGISLEMVAAMDVDYLSQEAGLEAEEAGDVLEKARTHLTAAATEEATGEAPAEAEAGKEEGSEEATVDEA